MAGPLVAHPPAGSPRTADIAVTRVREGGNVREDRRREER